MASTPLREGVLRVSVGIVELITLDAEVSEAPSLLALICSRRIGASRSTATGVMGLSVVLMPAALEPRRIDVARSTQQ